MRKDDVLRNQAATAGYAQAFSIVNCLCQINLSQADHAHSNILMSALSALLGQPPKPSEAKPTGGISGGTRKSVAIANTTLFLVDKNENFEWRENVSAVDDVFVDPSHPPVKGRTIQ